MQHGKSCFLSFSELREPILMIFGLLISYARALSRENKKVSRYRKSNLQFSEKPSKLKLRDETEKHGWEQNELQKSIKSENMIFLRRNVVRTPIKPLCTEQDRNRSPISNVLLQSSPNPGNQFAYWLCEEFFSRRKFSFRVCFVSNTLLQVVLKVCFNNRTFPNQKVGTSCCRHFSHSCYIICKNGSKLGSRTLKCPHS